MKLFTRITREIHPYNAELDRVRKEVIKKKEVFKYVYYAMHPFNVNQDVEHTLWNDELEYDMVEYKLKNLIIEYFGSCELFELVYVETTYDFVNEKTGLKLAKHRLECDWVGIKFNNVLVERLAHTAFYEQVDEVYSDFKRRELMFDSYYCNDDINQVFYNFKETRWEKICALIGLPFTSKIRYGDFTSFFIDNGYPIGIEEPAEYTTKKIQDLVNKYSKQIDLWHGEDIYISLLSSNEDLQDILTNWDIEFICLKSND